MFVVPREPYWVQSLLGIYSGVNGSVVDMRFDGVRGCILALGAQVVGVANDCDRTDGVATTNCPMLHAKMDSGICAFQAYLVSRGKHLYPVFIVGGHGVNPVRFLHA